MKRNYLTIHKNKKAKKLKYSKPFTAKQYKAMHLLNEIFINKIKELKNETP
jgi:hypothetical protein